MVMQNSKVSAIDGINGRDNAPWLDTIAAGKHRAKLTVDQLRHRIEEGRVEAPQAEERQAQREPASKQEEGIAYILNDPKKLQEFRKRARGARAQGGQGAAEGPALEHAYVAQAGNDERHASLTEWPGLYRPRSHRRAKNREKHPSTGCKCRI